MFSLPSTSENRRKQLLGNCLVNMSIVTDN